MARRYTKLTPEQELEVARRHELWRQNMPKRIAFDFGIDDNTVTKIVHRVRKQRCTSSPG